MEGNACFIVYGGSQQVHTRNFTFKIINNIVTQKCSAIYSASIYACFFLHIWGIFTIISFRLFFDYIGAFGFEYTIGSSKSLGTDGVIYSYECKEQLSAAPGRLLIFQCSLEMNLTKEQTSLF